MLRNIKFGSSFDPYKALNPATKKVKERAKVSNVGLPKTSSNNIMCLSYHIKGMCNTCCRFAADHKVQNYPDKDTML